MIYSSIVILLLNPMRKAAKIVSNNRKTFLAAGNRLFMCASASVYPLFVNTQGAISG